MTFLEGVFIPVRIHPVFWLLAAFIGWSNSGTLMGMGIWVVVVLVSLLAHEYGHALTAVAFGQRATIELMLFGGVTKHNGRELKNWQQFIIILNGPLASISLVFIAYGLQQAFLGKLSPVADYTLTAFWTINLFWTVVNLLPIHPLDGGQLLAVTLKSFFGNKGFRLALFIGMLFGGVVALFFFMLHMLLAGALFLLLAFESYRSWRYSLTMSESDHHLSYQQELRRAERLLDIRDFSGAESRLLQLTETTGSGAIHDAAVGYLAKLYLSQGRYRAAYQLLKGNVSHAQDLNLSLFMQAAFHVDDWESIQAYGDKAYLQNPSYQLALINARCHARLSQPIPAVGWLHCALRHGAPNLLSSLAHNDYNSIRSTQSFQTFLAKIQRGS